MRNVFCIIITGMFLFALAGCASEPEAEITDIELGDMDVHFVVSMTDRNDEVEDFLVALVDDDGEIVSSFDEEDDLSSHGKWEATFATLFLEPGTYHIQVIWTYTYEDELNEDVIAASESFVLEE